MRTTDVFTSNYLKAADLKNKRVLVVIDKVAMEEIGDGIKPVVYFKSKDKGLVLNKTNGSMIEEIAKTNEMDDWGGVQIVLYPTRVDFKGNRVPAIRVDYSANGKPNAIEQQAKEEAAIEDDFPF